VHFSEEWVKRRQEIQELLLGHFLCRNRKLVIGKTYIREILSAQLHNRKCSDVGFDEPFRFALRNLHLLVDFA
jgi:hypothetical protein